jgi:hypothetical protein
MDRRVTIPVGTRSIASTAALMADALSAQTGLRVSCCQGALAGVPWGMATITFEANNEPARNVVMRLIAAAAPSQSDRAYWLHRCDPLASAWCFINLAYTNHPAIAQTDRPIRTIQPDRWSNTKPGKP